jgi:hypothetical protein
MDMLRAGNKEGWAMSTAKMRVAIVSDLGATTGAARSFQRITRTLHEQYGQKNLELLVVGKPNTATDQPPPPYQHRERGVWYWQRLAEINSAQRLDLIHIFFAAGAAANAAAYFAQYAMLPYVVSLRGQDIGGADFDPATAEGLRYTIRNAAGLTSVTPEILARAVAFGEKPLHDYVDFNVIENGFDPRAYSMPMLNALEIDPVMCAPHPLSGR